MNIVKKIIHPVVYIFLIWILFSSPYFFNGKVPYSSTYQETFFPPWSAYPHPGTPVKNGAMPDIVGQIYPWKHYSIEMIKSLQIPLWNPYSFSGTPHLANYQSAVLSPFNIIFMILPFVDAWSLLVLLQPLLAGIFMYLFVRSLKVSKSGSLIASLSFMFCGFITVWMDYATLGYAILFLPLGLFAVEKYYHTKKIWFLILLSFTVPLSFFSGHFQISLYFLVTMLFFQLVYFLKKKNIYDASIVFLYTVLGLLISFPQILPSMEFYTQSLRSNIFQKGEIIPWLYLPTFISPDFFGNPVTRNDWFGHYAEWNGYIGLLPFMLAFFSFKNRRNNFFYFFFIVALFSILLAFQTPFLDLFFSLHIPVFSTSSASRIIVLFSFSFAALSGFGFDQLSKDILKKNIKPIMYWIAFFIIVFLSIWAIVLFKLLLPNDKIVIARQNLILPTLTFFVIIGSLCIILFQKMFKEKRLQVCISFLFILICSFDLFRFVTKWQPFDPKSLVFMNVPVSKEFKKISGYNRVIGNFGGEVCVFYKLSCLDGYDPLYIDRYGMFVYSFLDGKIKHAERSVVNFPKLGNNVLKALNLLNVTYVIHKKSDDFVPWTFPYWDNPGQFKQIFEDNAYKVFKNTSAFPRAFLVSRYEVEKSDQELIESMFKPSTDLSEVIFLENDPKLTLSHSGKATITDYSPNKIIIFTKSTGRNILFLSDPFYPGWKVYVDGNERKILRADFAFRAVVIEPGDHKVEFVYDPESFRFGIVISAAGIVGLIALCILLRRKS